MRHTAEVFLWGTRIGIVSQGDGDAAAAFEYDRDFLRSGIEVSPIAMPLSTAAYSFPRLSRTSFRGLPGLLADSLPDKFGNAVIDAWLARLGRPRESFSAIERLCYTGKRGMGALEYRPDEGPQPSDDDAVEVAALVQMASDVLSNRLRASVAPDDANLQALLKFGTSAGGARAKAVIALNAATGEVRSGQTEAGAGFSQWIMKFDGVSGNGDKEGCDPLGYIRVEYAYHLMSTRAGLRMNECRLFEEGPRSHFMTLRFDRDPQTRQKIHMQTLAALGHYDYQQAGSYGYEQAAGICLRLGLAQAELDELFRRMVFNVLAFNCDDHVKNISFLMDRKGQWSLAPAYDVTFAYNPHGAWTHAHQMSVNGKRWGIAEDDMLAAGSAMNITPACGAGIIGQVKAGIADWLECAAAAGVAEERAEAIDRYLKGQ